MKSILFVILLTIGLYAQNYRAGSYYDQQDYIEDICLGVAYYNYDYYGYSYPVYRYKHAEWHSGYGGKYIYVWDGYSWAYQYQNGSYYWYNWSYYYSY